MPETGIIILAAGQSRRMGQPKQLLKVGEVSLIQHIVKIAQSTSFSPIVVVLGSNYEIIKKEIASFEVFPVFNQNWENGIGTSIASGVKKIQNLNPNIKAVILLLVDQPFIQPSFLEEMDKLYLQSGKKVVASKYGNTVGVPALFDRSAFPLLASSEGNTGAKAVILDFMKNEEVALVEFPEGQFDLDTPGDYDRFLENSDKK